MQTLEAAAQAINKDFRGTNSIHSVGIGTDAVFVYSKTKVPASVQQSICAMAAPHQVTFRVVGTMRPAGSVQ